MTVAMQYLFQGWNCRMPGKYKDLILDVGTEELAHVEMISIMIARLLEGAPAETTAKACTDNPVLAAVVGGMNPAQAIVSGGGPLLADSSGQAWSGKYIVASGNLFADFHANDGLETLPVPAQHPFDERNLDHAYEFQNMSEHVQSAEGRWAAGLAPDGKGEFNVSCSRTSSIE
jgi:Mn-containing catalase